MDKRIDDLTQSIKGINYEIRKRKESLRHRKEWYTGVKRTFRHSYTWSGYYLGGYKLLQEIKKLEKIKMDLTLCIGFELLDL